MVDQEMSRILPRHAEDIRIPSTKRTSGGHFCISWSPAFTEHLSLFTSCASARFESIVVPAFAATVASRLVVCQNNTIEFKDEETAEDDETFNEGIESTS